MDTPAASLPSNPKMKREEKKKQDINAANQKVIAENKLIDPIVAEAGKIYADYVKRIKSDGQFISLSPQARYEYYMKVHIDFARQYPMILRHIASYGMHSEKAIRLYMKKCFSKSTDTDEEYCERQADFVKYLYMYSGRHIEPGRLNEIWAHTKKHIMNELEASKKERDIIKARREKNKDANNTARRESVKQRIQTRFESGEQLANGEQ
jgi:hypothetical protein